MKKIIIFNPVFVRNKVWTVLGAVLSLLLVTGSLNAQIDITLMSTSPTCNGYTDGMIESQVSGGTAPYSYLWSNGQTTQNLYGISGGTYTVNVSDATGNSGSAEISVEEPGELIVEIGVVGNVCLGTEGSLQAVVSGGTPPYEIIWDNGMIGVTNDNLHEGANTVNVTDANGCFDNALTIIGLPMSIEVATTDVACGGGCDGSAEVIITGGQGPYTYLWSNGETGPILQNLEAGTFCVTVTDALGCSLEDCGEVAQPTDLDVSIDIVYDDVECGETVTATATVTVSGGEPPYNINWSNGATGPVVTGLTPGSYFVHVVDQNGCFKKFSFKIEKPPVLSCDVEVEQPDCLGGGTGSATVSGIGGTAPYSYLWSNGATTAMVDDLAPGDYMVTVTDDIGCEAICYATINSEGSVNFNLTAVNANCGVDGSIIVNITDGDAPFDISWVGPVNGSTTTSDNPYTIDDLDPGQYLVTVEDANGCIGTKTVRIENPGHIRFFLTPSPAYCGNDNGSIDVTVTTGTPNFRIEWSGPVSGVEDNAASPYTITDLPPGDYDVMVMDANGCFDTNTITVGNIEYNIPLTITSDCDDNNLGSISVSWSAGTAPYTLVWTAPDNTETEVTDATSPFDLTGLTANGTYTFTVTDANGCDGTGEVNVNCNPVCPLICSTSSTPAICEQDNGTITVSVTGADGDVTVSIAPVGGTIVDNQDGTYTITGLAAGDYVITVTEVDDPNCTTTCDIAVGHESYNIDLTLVSSCVDSIGNINVSWTAGTAPYTLSWTDPNGTPGQEDNATSPFDISGLMVNGTYLFTITDANSNNGICEGRDSIELNCPDPCPLVCETSTTPDVCMQSNGSITVDITGVDGNYTIEWSGPSSGSDTSDSDAYMISGLSAGEYTIVITDESDTTCMTTCMATVIPENYDIDLTLTPSCVDSIGNINVSWTAGTAPYTLSWTDPNGTPGQEDNATSPFDISGLMVNGTYLFTITDANSNNGICEGRDSIELNCPDPCPLMSTATATDAICEQANGSITVNVSGIGNGYTIEWSGPSSGSDTSSDPVYIIADLAAGDYTVTVTSVDDSTCFRVHNVMIGQENYDLGLMVTDECAGSSRTLTATWIGLNTTPPYELCWVNPQNDTTCTTIAADTSFQLLGISADSSGLFIFTVTDSLGCSSTDSIELEVCCPITCEGTSTPAYCGNDNGTITVNVSDFNGGEYEINWVGIGPTLPSGSDLGVTDPSYTINNLPPGNYEITVIDGTNCLTSCEVTVDSTSYNIDVQAGFECITDTTANITVTWSTGTAPHDLIWSGPNGQGETVVDATSPYIIDNVVNGDYTFTVFDALGCDGTDTVTVECPPCPLECTVSSTPVTCIDSTGTVTVSVSGNSGPYSITLTPPGTTVTGITDPTYTFADLPAGEYTVLVSDSTDCTVERTVTIEDESYDIPLTVTAECGDSTGTITVTWDAGMAPDTLTWSGPNGQGDIIPGATSPFVLEGLTGNGIYSFTIRDSSGCSGSGSVELDCCFMRIMAESTPEDCLADNGTITVTISNGTAPYNIDWSGTESGSVSTSDNPYIVTDLTAGPYSLIVTDSLGCIDSLDIEVERIDTLSFDTNSRDIICETPGEICISNINGTPDFDISWTGPESGDTTISETGICLPITVPGDYIISIQDSIGCMAMSDTITIDSVGLSFDVKPKNRICETLGSIELCEITGSPDYEIMVTGPVNGVDTTIIDTVLVDNYAIDSLFAGSYFIKVTDANGCMDTTTVVIDSLDMLPFDVEVTDVICERRGEICVTLDCGTPDYEISLSGPVSETITTDSVHCFTDLPAGDYVIMVVDSFGCVGIDSVTVDSIDNLEIEAMAQNGLCGDSAYIDITILSGTPQFDIMWTGPVSGMDSTLNNTYGISITESGDYTIKVTDANGCMRDTTVTVIVSPPKEIEVGEVINETCDSLGKIIINVLSGTPDCTITWEGDNGINGSGISSNGGYAICDLTAGTYTVIAVDTFNCADTLTVLVDGPEDVAVEIESTPQMCDSLGSIKLTYLTGNGPIVCSVEGPNILIDITLSGPNDMELLDGLLAGEYVIECTDSLGCSALDTIIIIENIDVLEFTATANSSECGEGLGTIDIEITEGMSPFIIDWTGPESGTETTDESTYTITDLPTGTYSIMVTDNKGCMRDTTVSIDNGMAVDYDVEVTDITCDNPEGCIIISNIMGKPDYTIMINDTLTVISSGGPDTICGFTEPGIYTISVVDSVECLRDTTVEINGPDEIRVSVESENVNWNCLGSLKFTYDCGFGTATGMVVGNGITKEFTLENEGDMFICDNLPDGNYEIEITDENDNSFADVFTIERIDTELNVSITASALTILPDGSVDINVVVDPPGNYTYSWDVTDAQFIDDPSSPTPTFTPCTTRTYTVTVFEENCGCTGQASITIEVPPVCVEPYVYIPNAFAPNGNDRNEVFRIRSAFEDQIQLVTFIVYDRWGEEVFKAGNIKEGWDGTFKGEECPPDVFGYYIDVVCPDGNHFIRKGNVTLFR